MTDPQIDILRRRLALLDPESGRDRPTEPRSTIDPKIPPYRRKIIEGIRSHLADMQAQRGGVETRSRPGYRHCPTCSATREQLDRLGLAVNFRASRLQPHAIDHTCRGPNIYLFGGGTWGIEAKADDVLAALRKLPGRFEQTADGVEAFWRALEAAGFKLFVY